MLNKRRFQFSTFAVPALVMVSSMLCASLPAAAQELDAIVAIVNDDVILASELIEETKTEQARLQQIGAQVPSANDLQAIVLDQLIEEMLQIQQARSRGIVISETMLNSAIERIAENNQLTLAQLHQAIRDQGQSIAKLRRNVRSQMTIEEVRQVALRNRIQVSDKEIDAFLLSEQGLELAANEYHLSHIFFVLAADSDDATRHAVNSRIAAIQQELTAGADFGALAKQHSQANSAANNGVLGWRDPDKLPKIFAPVVATLEVGDVSGPISNDTGVHLVKVNDKRGPATLVANQTRAKHIFIGTNELRDAEAAKALVDDIYARLQNGIDFGELANAFSDDQRSSLQGGDTGWLNPGDLPEYMETRLNDLAIGAYSEPFAGPSGWHLLAAVDRKTKPVGQIVLRNRARDIIYQNKFADELDVWVRELRDEAYVEIRPLIANQ